MLFQPYTIFTRIVLFRTADGAYFTDELWQKDLVLHFDYISDLRLCCPVETVSEVPDNALPVPQLSDRTVYPLKTDGGWGSVLRNLVPSFRMVAKASGESEIVHSGGAGWAFPLSFYLLALRPFQKFQWIMVIESSFWMKPDNGKASLRAKLRHANYRFLLGRCLRRAEVCIFTQDWYRRYFNIAPDKSLIAPAVWVDEDQIISQDAHNERLASRDGKTVRFLFAARLIEDKGVETILGMVCALEAELEKDAEASPDIEVSIIGDGPLREVCERFADKHQGRVEVTVLQTVPYGAPFFALMREHDALIMANRQQEQPRIVFDAFSQGVPVISSRTDGVCDIVDEGETALLYPVDDAEGFAQSVLGFVKDEGLRTRMSNAAVKASRGYSHQGMHHTRAAFLEKILE